MEFQCISELLLAEDNSFHVTALAVVVDICVGSASSSEHCFVFFIMRIHKNSEIVALDFNTDSSSLFPIILL